jgi:tRNA nucleotidyltransferase (CCA-adding enzyme)
MVLSCLPGDLRALLAAIVPIAHRQQARIFLIGGLVRDALLGGGAGRDVDLALEGDVPTLSAAIVAQLQLRIVAQHTSFGTATLSTSDSHQPLIIDLAQTRIERYPQPAVLPEVHPASLEDDLVRRDFSINALAVELFADNGVLRSGPLIDRFGGVDDLAAHRLRILHPASFRDDPTRILRGLRLAARLGLNLDPVTQSALHAAIEADYLALLSVERIQNEICLALDEPSPTAILQHADVWGITSALLPGLRWSLALATAEERIRQALLTTNEQHPPALLYAGLLTYFLDEPARVAFLQRYRLPTEFRRLIAEIGRVRSLIPRIAELDRDSALEALLRHFSNAALLVVHYADQTPASEQLGHYLQKIRPLAPLLDGRDLQRLGVEPGPQLGALLASLRAAQLDGLVDSRETAEAWIRDTMTR